MREKRLLALRQVHQLEKQVCQYNDLSQKQHFITDHRSQSPRSTRLGTVP